MQKYESFLTQYSVLSTRYFSSRDSDETLRVVPLAEFLRTSSTELLVDYVPGNPPGASGEGKDKPAPAAEPSGKKPEG